MNYLLGFLILMINILVCLICFNKGLVLYIVFAFILPNIHFLGNVISYELFSFIPIFFIFFIRLRKLSVSYIHVLIYMYILLLLLSSLISINLYGVDINWIAFLGNVRFALVFLMLTHSIKGAKKDFEIILQIVISVNLLLSIVQVFLPQSVHIFYKFYFKDSMTPLQEALKDGRFYRTYGSFGTPVEFGGFSLITFSYFFAELLNSNFRKKTIIYLIVALLCGILSLSKTFILGIPIIFLVGFILKLISKKKNNVNISFQNTIKYITILLLIAMIGYCIIIIAKQKGLQVNWYFRFLLKPFYAFTSRYDSKIGILSSTLIVIKNNILIGVGSTRVMNEFLGDSSYILILHNTGLIGMITFMLIFAIFFFIQIKNRTTCGTMIIVVLLLCGLSYPAFISKLGAMVIWYVSSITGIGINEGHENVINYSVNMKI